MAYDEKLDQKEVKTRRELKKKQLDWAGLADNEALMEYEHDYEVDNADYGFGGFLPRSNTKERF